MSVVGASRGAEMEDDIGSIYTIGFACHVVNLIYVPYIIWIVGVTDVADDASYGHRNPFFSAGVPGIWYIAPCQGHQVQTHD